jgi:hypothetical protein
LTQQDTITTLVLFIQLLDFLSSSVTQFFLFLCIRSESFGKIFFLLSILSISVMILFTTIIVTIIVVITVKRYWSCVPSVWVNEAALLQVLHLVSNRSPRREDFPREALSVMRIEPSIKLFRSEVTPTG